MSRRLLSPRHVWIWIAALIAANLRADEAALRADVTRLATTIGPRSVFQGDSLKRSADYIAQRLASVGWTVRRPGYPVNGLICENLDAERRGTKRPEEIVVIGAHYDSVPARTACARWRRNW
jgi:acetylornithine deacetylase/succinyl-diaminopimelate desuccinylase-like protein